MTHLSTFPINLKTLSGGYSVNGPDVAAMRILFTDLKIVAEPAGTDSVAAALSNKPAPHLGSGGATSIWTVF